VDVTLRWVVLACSLSALAGCECATPEEPDGGLPGEMDARVPPTDGDMDAARGDGEVEPLEDGAVDPLEDASIDAPYVDPFGEGGAMIIEGGVLLPDGSVVACVPASCQGKYYQCGDCLDNDGDGQIDSADSNCLGPCDNNEAGLNLLIPGIGATCNRDCYFDQDSGSGNDDCSYSLQCDPLSPGVRPTGSSCPYSSTATCSETQSDTCLSICGLLTPNGCDCFGCCEIPGGTGNFVFLGSTPEIGQPPCSIATADNPGSCRPCTPTMGCFNPCGRCELCLGRDTIPADCFPPPPTDAGTPMDAGMVDSGPPVDSGPIDAGQDGGVDLRCPVGQQACGLPGDPLCPGGYYCLTGCCIYFG
jgi:hypothetical protein